MQKLNIAYQCFDKDVHRSYDDKLILQLNDDETDKIRKDIVENGIESLQKYTKQPIIKIHFMTVE